MENKIEFKINGDYIELLALLKAIGIAQTGGHAKMIVDSEEVNRNGTIELRRRAKCIKGDIIIVGEQSITLI
ncbi:RNA-binding S4 domain-containing protein [Crocinitomicaceae bacterium]|jgi:ribosome-associated protein|nr:RNA-binding S4 domain-containing protein [Crocinitomicaceae bacterium]